ncbi:MAG: gliding motility-associated C-terminal domain-containing protein [Flavobacterium sp.]
MQTSTIFERKAGLRIVMLFLLYLAFHQQITAQSLPVFANTITSQSNVDFINNSIDENLATRARIKASSGIALGIGAYSGNLELQFPGTLPANTTSFVKIQTDDNLLPSLLGGSLGGLLSTTLGAALIGNQEFTVQAKNGSSVILEGNSQIVSQFSTDRLRIVVNENNEYFIAITPNQPYDRIKLTNRVGSLVGLNTTKRLDVFGIYYIGTPDVCGGASYTSFEGSGLNLDLINLGGAGVTNPHYVLDSNPNNYSRLSLGVLGVAASIEQTVYFDGLSEPSDRFYVRMRIAPALLALGAANNIQVIASNGPNTVQTVNLNSLLNLDLLALLQANQVVTIPFATNTTVNRITIRYNSLLNVQLTQSLDLYDVIRTPAPPIITNPFTLNPRICAGTSASLIAQTGAGTELNWYSQPTGGAVLATTTSGQAFVTPVLYANASFYVSSKRIGCPQESIRVKIDVTVINVPIASDITIPDVIVACNGVVTLSPSASIGGVVYRYYKDQLKTQEITTGYSGDAGVTYIKNNATGELSVSGLNATDSPYVYYIAITADGLCENLANTLKRVTVNFSPSLLLNVSAAVEGCGSVNLRDAILNFDNSSDIQYRFFDSASNPISIEQAASITGSGVYYIQSVSLNQACSSPIKQVNVTVNAIPTLEVSETNYLVLQGNTFNLQATSNGTVSWFDPNGNQAGSTTVGPFVNVGLYAYTAVATNGNCFVNRTVYLTVTDPQECGVLTDRVYANSQSWSSIITGGVATANQAADGNPQTFSTIVTGLGLLGIGTTWQSLQWNETIPAGTPVTIKLGSQYSGLVMAGAYYAIATKRNLLGVPVDVGGAQPISGSLLDLLSGQNVFEFTFVPSDNTGPREYDGVRIIVRSVLSVAQIAKVYDAYYNVRVTQPVCDSNNVRDVFYGAVDLGVGAATATVGVANPFNSVDDDQTTYATMYSGAGILAAAELTVQFKTPTLSGDSLQIILSHPSTVLSMNLLTGFTIQMYLGDTPVGQPLDNTSTLLNVTLLDGGSGIIMLVSPQTQVYDRMKIRFGGVASVLDLLRVHYIKRVADTSVVGADINNTIEVCQNDTIRLSIEARPCATFIWYDAPVGGNIVSTGTSFTVPSTLPTGTYTYYIQPIRFGCPAYERGLVTVVVGENTPPNAIAQVSVNGTTVTTLCSGMGSVTLQAQLNSSLTITNPVFYWYSFNGTESVLIPNQNTSQLVIPNLAAGTYTYYVGLSSDEYCQTIEANRSEVTLTILPPSTANDVRCDNALICINADAVLTPSSSQPNPHFFWFLSNNASQPITNGLVVGGVTFSVMPNGQLSISGLTISNSPYTYYVAMSSDASCLNLDNNFRPVVVTVNDSGTPTTNDLSQDFCLADRPTLASVQINETNIEWYDQAIGGVLLPLSTPLVSGSVYYAGFDPSTGCGSATRLSITVTINDAPTPTTTNTTQDFCIIDNPTIANIQVNENGVTWYSAPIGGEVLNPANNLVDGAVYYASLTDAGTGCKSSAKLAVTVRLNDAETPSTNDITQDFCFLSHPTIANIQVNEPNVVWYTAATGGAIVPPTAGLVNNTTYYASLTNASSGCESSIRLAVTVTIIDVAPPTSNNLSQSFCRVNNPTIANIQVNEPNVSWYAAASGGSPLSPATALTNNTTYYASQTDLVSGCESSVRLAIAVTVDDPSTPSTTTAVQDFCVIENPTVANIQVNQSNVVWYASITGGIALSTSTPLQDGTVYYAAQVNGATGCESSIRLAVTVHVNDALTPTTTNAAQQFCLLNQPTVAAIQVNEPNVVWYTAATGGAIVPPTAGLVNNTTYYASLTNASSGCESSIRLAVTVTIIDVAPPTSNNLSQSFCRVNNPTIANIQVNEPNVSWYASATGGSSLSPATVLANNTTYYASQTDLVSGCESSVRLAVAVTVDDPSTPTTTTAVQDFCVIENPTIANIQVNQANVVWYASITGGIALSTSAPLQDGTVYYATQVNGATGCESSIRLAVTVHVNDALTPTTTNAAQQFCLLNQPTVANIQVNEPNVVWYTAATGGTIVPPATALVNNTIYYASLVASSGCESSIRLAVTVSFVNGESPVISGNAAACVFEEITYATTSGMSNYIWAVTNGTVISGGQSTDNSVTVSWPAISSGNVSVSYSDSCSGVHTAEKTVLIAACSDIAITKTVDNPTPNIGQQVTFTITVSNIGPGLFQNVTVSEMIPTGYLFVSATASSGIYSNADGIWTIPVLTANQSLTLIITVEVLSSGDYQNTVTITSSNPIDLDLSNNTAIAGVVPLCLIVYNEFSPNGDGANDTFRIDCIENYPNCKLEIYNRYGKLVFSQKGYNNDWEGTANSATTGGDEKLPSGTYYYVLDVRKDGIVKTGWVSFIR